MGIGFSRHYNTMNSQVLETIENFIRTLLPSMELELVEIQFRREGHGWVLRIFIDHKDGVTLDHCTNVSREISAYLDVEDLIDHAYHLEVSSPGLERPLYTLADFVKHSGKKAKIKLQQPIDGQKTFTGEIQGVDGEDIILVDEKMKEIRFTLNSINKARLSL